MKKKRLFWHLVPSYILITLISIAAISFYASGSLRNFFIQQTSADLIERARILKQLISPYLSPLDAPSINEISSRVGQETHTRITVILKSGLVIGDSEKDPELMEPHSDRPEIIETFTGGNGVSIRYSWTLKKNMIYVAVPLPLNGEIFAALRVALPLDAIDDMLKSMKTKIALAGLITLMLAGALSLYVSRRISRPIEDIKSGAEQFARGNLGYRLPETDPEEIDSLSKTMNHMAGLLEARIRTVIRQKNELEVVLSGMVEGVIAVDQDEKIIKMNPAALKLFSILPSEYEGRCVQEVIRSVPFHRFVRDALKSPESLENDIVLYANAEIILHAYSTPLFDAHQEPLGILIVFNDVTTLRKLENMRRDFAANVSHEIKTPLTAIKGFVETLQHGDNQSPEDIQRFLSIVGKHVNRLNAIVEDLLTLSRIEQSEDILLEQTHLKAVLWNAVQTCQHAAETKNIRIILSCGEELEVRITPPLFEQAALNLLDNAIKYSDAGSEILVTAVETDKEVLIHFQDHGIGIARQHIPRLFERFYRIDKARSRKAGGTGLGLSIVKHTIQAHGGQVTVDSTPGKGSTFTIHLPKP